MSNTHSIMQNSIEKKIKIVCQWPEEAWVVLEQLTNDNHSLSWSEIYRSPKIGEAGYMDVMIWINNNMKKPTNNIEPKFKNTT